MKICLISHEYPPFPGGGISTYTEAAARCFARAGHQVYVITNRASFGESAPALTLRFFKDGNLTLHRLELFDEWKNAPSHARFFDTNPALYSGRSSLWAYDSSNLAAFQIASFLERLHAEVGIDVVETPEYFAEPFYAIRRRRSGKRGAYPPICVIGHTSTRELLDVNKHTCELGSFKHRLLMAREEYCIQSADALQTPSRSLLQRYEKRFGSRLPELRAVIPYFLELPGELPAPPKELGDGSPYLLMVGRIEPRKGCDTAARAFSLLAPEFPDLKLACLGREAWRNGESFEEVLERVVPAEHRGRVLRLGNMPRQQTLAAVQKAAVFIHPAPWDNHPNAVLEAMGLGAACVVSDCGGQSEMVEDGTSGVLFQAGNAESLAAALRRVLRDPAFRERISKNAARRIRSFTDARSILEKKIELFAALADRERRHAGTPRLLDPPPFLKVQFESPPLPGRGLVVLDACMTDKKIVETSVLSLRSQITPAPEWRAAVLQAGGDTGEIPKAWDQRRVLDPTPWLGAEDQDIVVFVKAGARLDEGALHGLVTAVHEAPAAAGAFLWLRPANAQVFPYRADANVHDLLLGGSVVPPVFAVRAGSLRLCQGLEGLSYPEARLCALMAAAAAAGGFHFQHTGDVCGDFYLNLPIVTEDVQSRAVGYLEMLGLLAPGATAFGSLETPTAPPIAGAPPPNQSYLADLEKVRDEHLALKQLPVVRFLRKLRAFDILRKVLPRTKKMIGPGG